jgi:tRNA (cytidine/uridine-2'-O-)-methyltransferase
LPGALWERRPDRCLTIPMRAEARSINLAIAVGIIAYEALRQTGWPDGGPAEFS